MFNWERFISQGMAVVLASFDGEDVDGCIGCIVAPDVNDGAKTYEEAFWFVKPDKRGTGVRLLKAMEFFAAMHGCKRMFMIHLSDLNPGLGGLYERRGYRKQEVRYVKEF